MEIINLDGIVGWDIEAKEFGEKLDSITGDITFEINSPGGYVTDGVAILNKIRSYNKGKTTARISYAASMMTQIALACDEVKVYDNAIFMIHNVQGFVYGDHNEMREVATLQERMSDMLGQLYCKKTHKTAEEIKSMMDNDTYLFGAEIKDMGFADEVIDTEKKSEKAEELETKKEMNDKAKNAMKEEKLSSIQLKEQFKQCIGNCNLASMPSDNEKMVNSDIGNGVSFKNKNDAINLKNEGEKRVETIKEVLVFLSNATAEDKTAIKKALGADEEVQTLSNQVQELTVKLSNTTSNETVVATANESMKKVFDTVMSETFKNVKPEVIKQAIETVQLSNDGNFDQVKFENVLLKSALASKAPEAGGENNQTDPYENQNTEMAGKL